MLTNSVKDLLDYSQISKGKLVINKKEVNLNEIVSEVIPCIKIQAKLKDLRFVVDKPSANILEINTDPERLMQVLMNLLTNAIKFSSKGTISLRISDEIPDKLKFTVQDEGIGIQEQDIKNLFMFYNSVDNKELNVQGVGLGLSVSQAILHALEPKTLKEDLIKVASIFQKGSTFSFLIGLRSEVDSPGI